MLLQDIERDVSTSTQTSLSASIQIPFGGSAKPLLRGWLHAAAAPITVLLTLVLAARDGSLGAALPILLFGGAMTELYAVSAIFHTGRWLPRRWHMLRIVDHASIFVAIAAGETALCLVAFSGWARTVLPVVIWLLALGGIALKVRAPHLPRPLSTALYVALGWTILPALPALWASVPMTPRLLMLVAGMLYTIGASVYARRKPDLLPSIFGYHELFHLLVVAGGFAALLALCMVG